MVVVVGASGFIGVYTADALQRAGYEVLGTGRNQKFAGYYTGRGVGYVPLDLRDKNAFEALPKRGVEAVVFLAGLLPANEPVDLEKSENAEEYFIVNTVGTLRMLEYCRKNGIRRAFSTTTCAEVFGSWNKTAPLTEEEPVGFPPSGDHAAYAVSKRASVEMMEYYNRQHGMQNAVFRLPPVYGAGPHGSLYENGRRVKSGLRVFMDRARSGENIEVFGNGEVARDCVYVKDVADAFVRVLQSTNARGLYNISCGRKITLREQAEAIAKAFAGERGVSRVVYRSEVPNRSASCRLDSSKAQKEFGYAPRYADFTAMMEDYRKEEDRGVFSGLFG